MGSIKENYEFFEWLRKEKSITSINIIEAMELYWDEFKGRDNKPTIYDKYL